MYFAPGGGDAAAGIRHSRSGDSAHTRGLAADIRCNAGATRMKIVRAALALGITRIGIGSSFVHVDIDRSLPQDTIWHYY